VRYISLLKLFLHACNARFKKNLRPQTAKRKAGKARQARQPHSLVAMQLLCFT
jgi:hypothetical protein